jgi:ParB-like chromosome segregation protein Spo0J
MAKSLTKGIKSSRPKSDFDEKDIEDLADSMIANGGAMRPLILGKVGFQSYEVVDGHLTYHAAVRAKEKDIRRMEEVNGFVLEPENMANVAKQLEILDSADPTLRDRADGKKKR